MANVIITNEELETIMKLIDDFGFEYSLKCKPEEVAALKESLSAAQDKNIEVVE